jgi:HemY protein
MISRPIRWVLWLLGMAAFAVAVALAGRHGSGYVVMVAPPFRVEMSVMMFVILAVAAFALGYVLIRLGVAAYGLPQHLKKRHAEQDRAKARDAVFTSLELLFSGRCRDAEERHAPACSTMTPATAAALAAWAVYGGGNSVPRCSRTGSRRRGGNRRTCATPRKPTCCWPTAGPTKRCRC